MVKAKFVVSLSVKRVTKKKRRAKSKKPASKKVKKSKSRKKVRKTLVASKGKKKGAKLKSKSKPRRRRRMSEKVVAPAIVFEQPLHVVEKVSFFRTAPNGDLVETDPHPAVAQMWASKPKAPAEAAKTDEHTEEKK